MAALMTSVMGDGVQIAKYIRNCNEMSIGVLPPSIIDSSKKFTVVDGKIHFGLLGVKNVGAGVIDEIIKSRESKGKPKDIFQFISNVNIHEINKKAVESLIKAGAFDCLNENRAQHLSVYESLLESAQNNSKKNIEGQISLFQLNSEEMEVDSVAGKLPDVAELPQESLMAMEKEMLGVYLTSHPLKNYEEQIDRIVSVTAEELAHADTDENVTDGMKATIAGIVSGKKTLVTKNNKQMAFLDIEDLYGQIEVVVFPNVYEKYLQLIKEESILVIRGTVNFKEDEAPKILADKIAHIDAFGGGEKDNMVKIKSPRRVEETKGLSTIKELIVANKGEKPVMIYIEQSGKSLKPIEIYGWSPMKPLYMLLKHWLEKKI